MTTRNIEMIRANTYPFRVYITNGGAPVNITGNSFRMSAKWSPTDASVIFTLVSPTNITIVDASNGEILVTIPPSSTNTLPLYDLILYFDIQMTTSGSEVSTVCIGKLKITPNISITSP